MSKRAEERAFAYQRELGMIDSVSDEHIVARRMGFYDGYRQAEKDLVSELQRRHDGYKVALEEEKDPRSKHAVDLIARIREDSQLIELVDSLPEEKPSEDLEEAADKHIRKVVAVAGHPGWDWTTQDIADAFIAGANWQERQFTWEDIANIDVYMSDVECEFRKDGRRLGDDTFYKEVFKRFKEEKK